VHVSEGLTILNICLDKLNAQFFCTCDRN
jgi:hypothetical protein